MNIFTFLTFQMITEWNMQLDVCVFLEILCTLFFTHVRQAAQTDEETRASNPKENIVESHNSLLLLLKNILPFLNKVIVIWGENEVITKVIINITFSNSDMSKIIQCLAVWCPLTVTICILI